MSIEDMIRSFGAKKNILLGICDAKKLDYLDGVDALEKTPFINAKTEARINPLSLMENAGSVIVVGAPYETDIDAVVGECRHKFSAGVLGIDYHVRIKKILIELGEYLQKSVSFDYKILIDAHPLVERELAKKAGIGWQGKNCMLISEKFGSYFNIGVMLASLSLNPDKGFGFDFSLCGDCNACLNACIGGCLTPYRLDYKKCVSYLTQKKDCLTEREIESLNGYVYGCDVCQLVCKFNRGKPFGRRFADLNTISKSDLGSAAWRGKNLLLRNVGFAEEKL